MKLLVDTCVAVQVVMGLRTDGHDVEYAAEWPTDPGDDSILQAAREQMRTIITRDKDFGQLAVMCGRPHRGIVQLRRLALRELLPACRLVLDAHQRDLLHGALVTVQPGRIRVRKPVPPWGSR